MRLGADPVKLHAGTARARALRRGRHLRAPPSPLRGLDLPAQAPGARRPRRLRHVAGRAPRRDRRARATTRSSWPRSSTRSSSRAPSARRRCSASSCGPRWTARRTASTARARSAPRAARAVDASEPVAVRPASEVERRRLNELFAELCAIPSPVRRRGPWRIACARARRARPERRRGRRGAELGGDAGNLLARIPGRDASASSCSAPTSTPSPHGDAPIEPVVEDGGWENASDAILGADNKAAVAVLLAGRPRASRSRARRSASSCCSPSSEENALAGRQGLRRRAAAQPTFGYVFDHATPIGEIVVASPTYYRLEAEFRGTRRPRRHPARGRPQRDRRRRAGDRGDAPRAPRRRDDRQRRRDPRRASGATNIVARALPRSSPRRARSTRPRPRTRRRRDGRPLPRRRQRPRVRVRRRRRRRAAVRRLPPQGRRRRRCWPPRRRCAPAATSRARIVTGGGSDANAFEAAGFPCTNLANGTERNHEPTERVSRRRARGHARRHVRPPRRGAAAGMSHDDARLRAARRQRRSSRAASSRARRALPLRRRRGGRARDRPPPGRRRRSSRSTTTHVWLVAPAARGDRRPRRRSSCPPAGSTRTGEPPLETAQRELAEEIGKQAARWEHLHDLPLVGRVHRRDRPRLPRRRARATRRRPTPARTSASRSCAGRSTDLDGADRRRPRDAKTLIGLLLLAAAPLAHGPLHRAGGPPAGEPPAWPSPRARRAQRRRPARDALHGEERAASAPNAGPWPLPRTRRTRVRAPRARLPRLPRVRARPVAQHARGLPLRPAAVRRVPRARRASTSLDATAHRPRRRSSTSLAAGDDDRPPSRPRRSSARPRACAPSTATCAART